ncbi:MAG: hypothetical protein ABI171_00675 [Collimonas sp.]|uniref:hypothetical protein n=1 Tax=Collimonas sp. TaxID=1963772 RepID=UPI0032665879
MPNAVGFVDNSTMLAHYKMLEKIRDFTSSNGWTVLRYDAVSANRELILQGPGLSGDQQIFIGFRTYQDVASDYYNLVVAGFTGYVAGNTFDTQPGAVLSGIPAHNQRIDYWLTLNGNRIALGLKVGTPVYEHVYAGYGLTRTLPSQYPYPLVIGGMLNGVPAVRFSDTGHSFPYRGTRSGQTANLRLRFNSGAWLQTDTWPWNAPVLAGTTQLRDTGANYPILPIILMDANGMYCELDGIFYISGFDNVTENTFIIAGINYVVLQDVGRNGFTDYIAMRLDA